MMENNKILKIHEEHRKLIGTNKIYKLLFGFGGIL